VETELHSGPPTFALFASFAVVFLPCFSLVAGALVLPSCGNDGGERGGAPSVLLIVVDTLRADHLGAYGYARPTSANIDALARGGALFEQAQSASSWTLPSMASLLTGLAPSRHGCGVERDDQGAVLPREFRGLAESVPTLAEAFAAGGYATAAVVTNSFMKPAFGLQQGFQHYDARFPMDAKDAVDELLAWFEARPERPFFVLAHFMDPHLPYDAPAGDAPAGDAPAGFRGSFTKDTPSRLSLPVKELKRLRQAAATISERDRAFVTAAYDEEIAFVDSQIGRLLDALRSAGALDGAFVVLTADHGEELFEHEGFEHGHSMYQELLHVPLIVSGPGIESRRIATPVSLLDVAATIRALTGAPPGGPGGIGGQSLVPELRGEISIPRALLSEGTLYGENQDALLDWPNKVVARPSGALAFDLARDPLERGSLALAPAFEGLRTELERRQAEERSRAEPAPLADLDPVIQGDLEDLGYAGDR